MDAATSQSTHDSIAQRNRDAVESFRNHVRSALTTDGRVCYIDANDQKQAMRIDVTSVKGLMALALKLVSDHELKRERRVLEKEGDSDLFTDVELRLMLAESKLYTWLMEVEMLELDAAMGSEDAKRKLRNAKRRYPSLYKCDCCNNPRKDH